MRHPRSHTRRQPLPPERGARLARRVATPARPTTTHAPRPVARVAFGLSAIVIAGITLVGCGDGGAALAHQACADVERSLHAYAAANSAPTSAAKAADERTASDELRDAIAPSALAAGGDGTWQALAATVAESSQPSIDESDLVGALTAQCAGMNSGS